KGIQTPVLLSGEFGQALERHLFAGLGDDELSIASDEHLITILRRRARRDVGRRARSTGTLRCWLWTAAAGAELGPGVGGDKENKGGTNRAPSPAFDREAGDCMTVETLRAHTPYCSTTRGNITFLQGSNCPDFQEKSLNGIHFTRARRIPSRLSPGLWIRRGVGWQPFA